MFYKYTRDTSESKITTFNILIKKFAIKSFNLKNSPNGRSQRRHVAAKAPAEAPEIFLEKRCGAYFLMQIPTPEFFGEEKSSI